MKKIQSPLANGLAPWTNERFLNIQDDLYKVVEGMLSGISPIAATGNVGVIISGCVVTGSGPYNCTPGIIYLNGEFMEFAGFTAQTLPRYIVPLAPIVTNATWANSSSNPLTIDKQATHQSGLPGSGQYITLSTTGNNGGLGGYRFGNVGGDLNGTLPNPNLASKYTKNADGVQLLTKIINVGGTFDLDGGTATIAQAHGLTADKIVSIAMRIKSGGGPGTFIPTNPYYVTITDDNNRLVRWGTTNVDAVISGSVPLFGNADWSSVTIKLFITYEL
jgi:hypothetical protein